MISPIALTLAVGIPLLATMTLLAIVPAWLRRSCSPTTRSRVSLGRQPAVRLRAMARTSRNHSDSDAPRLSASFSVGSLSSVPLTASPPLHALSPQRMVAKPTKAHLPSRQNPFLDPPQSEERHYLHDRNGPRPAHIPGSQPAITPPLPFRTSKPSYKSFPSNSQKRRRRPPPLNLEPSIDLGDRMALKEVLPMKARVSARKEVSGNPIQLNRSGF